MQWSVKPSQPASPPCRPCDQCSGAGRRRGSSLSQWPGAATLPLWLWQQQLQRSTGVLWFQQQQLQRCRSVLWHWQRQLQRARSVTNPVASLSTLRPVQWAGLRRGSNLLQWPGAVTLPLWLWQQQLQRSSAEARGSSPGALQGLLQRPGALPGLLQWPGTLQRQGHCRDRSVAKPVAVKAFEFAEV